MMIVLVAFLVGVAAGSALTWHFAEVALLRQKAAELERERADE